jgi:hypothetical protein
MKLYALCATVTVASAATVVGSIFTGGPARSVELSASGSDGMSSWLIPLLALALVALFIGQSDDTIPIDR